MNVILLSGGSGKRLWPLSNDIRSKQFIKIFKTPQGTYESMVQRVFRQIYQADSHANVTIAAPRAQISAIHNQLGKDVRISVEPCRRDTFPAISLAAAYLHDVGNIPEDESVVICPVDPYVEDSYFRTLKKLDIQAKQNSANLVLMGIAPTYPSEKYGYIIPESGEDISSVSCFREKPDAKSAENYIRKGALWNGGVFACKIGYLLEKAQQEFGFSDYRSLYEQYGNLKKISFDYAVVEKEHAIQVVRYNGAWKDVGTWNTLSETMEEPIVGSAILSDTCQNVHVLNELQVPVVCMGLKDVVVSASPEGILVSDKGQSSYIKPIVDKIDQQTMFAEKSWGSYRVLDAADTSLTVLLTLNPGSRMNYHCHAHRDEVWTITSGRGTAILDGVTRPIQTGDVLTMNSGCCHSIYAATEMRVIEVQLGQNITAGDKQKYPMPETFTD